MPILSRYVLRQFLSPLGLGLVCFLAIFIVIDLVDRLGAFIDRDVEVGLIVTYYLWYVPYVAVLILPMSLLLASLFSVGGLARRQELTAMKATGASLYRILLPVQLFALLLSIAAFFFSDSVLPTANRRRLAIDKGENPFVKPFVMSQVTIRDVDGQIMSVREYRPEARRGAQVTVDQYKGRKLVRKTSADAMVWKEERWHFLNGEVRDFDAGDVERVRRFREMPGETLASLPADLSRKYRTIEQMSYSELGDYIRRQMRHGRDANRELVERHLRISFSFAGFVMVIFGLPLASRFRATGRPLQFGICLLASFLFYGCIQLGRTMGWNGLVHPFLGAWAPNLLFLGIGCLLLAMAHK